jgi:hypothetical protein
MKSIKKTDKSVGFFRGYYFYPQELPEQIYIRVKFK